MHTAALSAAVRRLSVEDERRSGFVVGLQALQRLLSRRILQLNEAETVTWTRAQICLC